METRKKVVWLPGWFPSSVDSLSGDFIERHAQAVSQYADVTVVFVARDVACKKKYQTVIEQHKNLFIYRGYYKGVKGLLSPLVSAFQFYFLLNKLYKMAALQHGPFKHVHVCVALKQSFFALLLCIFRKKEIIISEHNSWFIAGDDSFAHKPFFFKWLIKKIFAKSAAIHAVSAFLGNALVGKKLVTSSPVVIPNVVNTDFFYRIEKSNTDDVCHFATVTGDVYIKNTDAVLRCFSRLRQQAGRKAVLHVIGPNDEVLKQQATQLQIESSVIFYGASSNKKVAAVMQECNALIFFSRFETFGCVVAEALCCGLPVIAANLPVLHENLVAGENAIFVDSGDEAALTQAMAVFMVNEGQFNRDAIAAAAAKKYNYAEVGKQIEGLYQ